MYPSGCGACRTHLQVLLYLGGSDDLSQWPLGDTIAFPVALDRCMVMKMGKNSPVEPDKGLFAQFGTGLCKGTPTPTHGDHTFFVTADFR